MKHAFLLGAVVAALVLAGCTGNAKNNESTASGMSESSMESRTEPTVPSEAEESSMMENEGPADLLAGLTENEYPEVEITAAVLPRNAILPGATIPVTVTVTNNGDKTLAYTQGSGAFETPEAVHITAEGLQVLKPRDHLGPVTMDFAVKELKPGEQLQYNLYVRAVEPHSMFNDWTDDLFGDNERYIGDEDWPALQEKYPELTAAKAGSYEGKAYFRYAVLDDENDMSPLMAPTGYASVDFTVPVNGEDPAEDAALSGEELPTEGTSMDEAVSMDESMSAAE